MLITSDLWRHAKRNCQISELWFITVEQKFLRHLLSFSWAITNDSVRIATLTIHQPRKFIPKHFRPHLYFPPSRHFLFYFKDGTWMAHEWTLRKTISCPNFPVKSLWTAHVKHHVCGFILAFFMTPKFNLLLDSAA